MAIFFISKSSNSPVELLYHHANAVDNILWHKDWVKPGLSPARPSIQLLFKTLDNIGFSISFHNKLVYWK